jgi:cold shock CspA family protein
MQQMPTVERNTNALYGEPFISTPATIILNIDGLLRRAFERCLSPMETIEQALLKHVAHKVAAWLMRERPDIFKAIEAGRISFDEGIKRSLDSPPPSRVTGQSIEAAETISAKETLKVRGTVKFFNGEYGFIVPEGEPQPDVYIHRNVLQWAGIPRLDAGQRVEFELRSSLRNGRPAADNIKLLHDSRAKA